MCQHFAAQKGRKWLFSPFYNKLFQRGCSDKSKSVTFCKHSRCTYNWRKWQMLAVLTFSSKNVCRQFSDYILKIFSSITIVDQ